MKLSKRDWEHMQRQIKVPDKGLPNADLHSFNEDLFCKWCGISMLTHWAKPLTCVNGPTKAMKRARLVSGKKASSPRLGYAKTREDEYRRRNEKRRRKTNEEG